MTFKSRIVYHNLNHLTQPDAETLLELVFGGADEDLSQTQVLSLWLADEIRPHQHPDRQHIKHLKIAIKAVMPAIEHAVELLATKQLLEPAFVVACAGYVTGTMISAWFSISEEGKSLADHKPAVTHTYYLHRLYSYREIAYNRVHAQIEPGQ